MNTTKDMEMNLSKEEKDFAVKAAEKATVVFVTPAWKREAKSISSRFEAQSFLVQDVRFIFERLNSGQQNYKDVEDPENFWEDFNERFHENIIGKAA